MPDCNVARPLPGPTSVPVGVVWCIAAWRVFPPRGRWRWMRCPTHPGRRSITCTIAASWGARRWAAVRCWGAPGRWSPATSIPGPRRPSSRSAPGWTCCPPARCRGCSSCRMTVARCRWKRAAQASPSCPRSSGAAGRWWPSGRNTGLHRRWAGTRYTPLYTTTCSGGDYRRGKPMPRSTAESFSRPARPRSLPMRPSIFALQFSGGMALRSVKASISAS